MNKVHKVFLKDGQKGPKQASIKKNYLHSVFVGGNNKVNCCTSCVPVGLLKDMSYFKLTNNRPTYTYASV